MNEGNYMFYKITVHSVEPSKASKELTLSVAGNHGMIVFKNEFSQNTIIKYASKLYINDIVYANGKLYRIVDIELYEDTKMYNLITKDGTVITNEILTSTICDTEINEDLPFNILVINWRTKHNYK